MDKIDHMKYPKYKLILYKNENDRMKENLYSNTISKFFFTMK